MTKSKKHTNSDTVEEFWDKNDLLEIVGKHNHNEKACSEAINLFASKFGFDTNFIYQYNSARYSLYRILKAIKRKENCDEVLVLAFNCPVVYESIESAGLKPVTYDFYEQPGNFDWNTITDKITSSTVAIIITHLFGHPVDFRIIIDYCRSNGIVIIEDCAHCLGGKISDKTAGTLGDASIISFNYDKPISLGWGGLAIINNQKFFTLNNFPHLKPPTVREELVELTRFLEYMKRRRDNIGFRSKTSRLFEKLVRSIGLRANFTAPISCMGILRATLLTECLKKYESVKVIRNENSLKITRGNTKLFWPTEPNTSQSTLKIKFNASTAEKALKLSRILVKQGVRAGRFNWPTLIPGSSSELTPVSASVANSWIDIPCHQNLSDSQIANISEVLLQS